LTRAARSGRRVIALPFSPSTKGTDRAAPDARAPAWWQWPEARPYARHRYGHRATGPAPWPS
jgi:hypothetical protein